MVKISLPNPNDYSIGISGRETAVNIKHFLRQLELSVHHLQKSVEQLEKDGMLTEDSFIMFRFPRIGSFYDKEQDNEGYIKIHVDEESDEFQEIEVEIA